MASHVLALCLIFFLAACSGGAGSSNNTLNSPIETAEEKVGVDSVEQGQVGSGGIETEGEVIEQDEDPSSEPPIEEDDPGSPEESFLRWSDTSTWEGSLPQAGDTVTITPDMHVLLDMSTPDLGGLIIQGTLEFDRQDLSLTADYILVSSSGRLQIGSASEPFTHQATITLNDNNMAANAMGQMGTRGLLVMGGDLYLYGSPPEVPWTQIAAHALAGTTSLTLTNAVDWNPGDEIVIAPTDYYGINQTESYGVASSSGTTLNLQTPLQNFRWGRLQYVNDSGMDLSPDVDFLPPALPAPTVLDERAEVGNLTRNIVIQGPNDVLWQQEGFGAHVMVMGLNSGLVIDGVQFRRVGQAGITARYPFHWHLLSYNITTGAENGDVSGHIFRNSSIQGSANRCIVIHGTNGVTVQNNICYDIRGHGIFLEDAVERRNLVEDNLVLRVRNPADGDLLLQHESDLFSAGSSGLWQTNPDNIVRRNVAADCQGNGLWLAFPDNSLGLNTAVNMIPSFIPLGIFENNKGHSNQNFGMNIDWVPIDPQGNIAPNSYAATIDGRGPWNSTGRGVRGSFNKILLYKNGQGGLWNRVALPDYQEFVVADNLGPAFSGAGVDGTIERSLVVGYSLNNLNPRPSNLNIGGEPTGFATYHGAYSMRDNMAVNFPFVSGRRSGVFRTNDYYVRPVEESLVRNPNNRIINSHPGFRSPPPNSHSALAGALRDSIGYWGPAGNFWVYDNAFFTHDLTCQPVEPAGENGMSCDGLFYGALEPILNLNNERWEALMGFEVSRVDENGDFVGSWTVLDGNGGWELAIMRHFALARGGRYIWRFIDNFSPPPFDVGITLENAYRSDDHFILGVHFDGDRNDARAFVTTYYSYDELSCNTPDTPLTRQLTLVNTYNDLVATPGSYYQDSEEDLIWVHYNNAGNAVTGPFDGQEDFRNDNILYKPRYLRVCDPTP